MTRSLHELLYGSTHAEFKSEFGLQESVDRLRAATRRSVFSALSEQVAVGSVKESKVRLQRVIPMIGNSFKPFFFGRFETRGADVYLSGKFTMLPFVKVFMTMWLGMALSIGIVALLATGTQGAAWPGAIGGLGVCGLGIAFVWLAKWFTRNDIAWLSRVIRDALAVPTATDPTASPSQSANLIGASGTPTVLRVIAGVVALMGVFGLTMAILGTESMQWSSKGATSRDLWTVPPRLLAGANAIVLLALALGVYRRKLLAWRLGLVYIGVAWCVSIAQLFVVGTFPAPPVIRIIFSGLSLVVVAYWGRWWYAQRVHFESGNEGWPMRGA
jgi:hypothetical protein